MSRFKDITYLKTVYDPLELEECAAEVAFVGRSNVGKSTLINVVCGKRDLARTSQTPGRTRTVNVYLVGKNKWLIDLPGYGFAMGPKKDLDKFKMMNREYLLNRTSLRMVYMIVDGNVGATELDGQMAAWLQKHNVPFVVVANKCDKIAGSKLSEQHKKTSERLGMRAEDIRWISAEKGIGTGALANEIADILELI